MKSCGHLLVVFSLVSSLCYGQQTELFSGMIADEGTFAALPYASIQIKNSLKGTYSDEKGKFNLVASRTDTLLISMVGYETLEQPLTNYESSIILLKEKVEVLKPVIVTAPYTNDFRHMFDEQISRDAQLRKRTPFYLTRDKKDERKAENFIREDQRARTYVSVVLNPAVKDSLKAKYELDDREFYALLGEFNEQHYEYMYYLSAPELLTLLNHFFDAHSAPGGEPLESTKGRGR